METQGQSLRGLLDDFVKRNYVFYRQEPQTKLTPLSRLTELVAYVNGLDDFNKEYEHRKKHAPDWFTALEIWISQIEIEVSPTDILGVQQVYNLTGEAYYKSIQGIDPPLYSFHLYTEHDLEKIVYGFVYAHKLSTLKDEYKKLRNEKMGELKNEINFQGDIKIEWIAGPAYLGHLIDELESKGYIKLKGKNLTEKANEILSVFNLKTTIGTFEKELSERQNSLTPDSKNRFVIKPYKSN